MNSARLRATAAPLAFLAIAAVLALAGWLRPPLSHDIDALQLSLGLWGERIPAGEFLGGERPVAADSAGILLILVLLCGAAVALIRPARTHLVAGALLSVAIAVNAAAALNQPALIERLESERAERQQIVQILRYSPTADPMSTPTNGRISLDTRTVASDPVWAGLVNPWEYLLYGRWLVVWAMLGVWFATRGPLSARARQVAAWSTLGVLLAAGVCLPRLRAEGYWIAANKHERNGDIEAARESLRRAVTVFPEFNSLQRTFHLTGKLDYLAARSTPAETIFRAAQLSRIAVPSQVDVNAMAQATARLSRAVGLLEPLLAADTGTAAMARRQMAQTLTDAGLALYLQAPRYTDAGLDYSQQQQHLIAAHEAWQRAIDLDPTRVDGRIYLSYTHRFVDRSAPHRAQPQVVIADRLLQADVLNMLGDAYFEAGLVEEARILYAKSLDLLNLPQRKNFRAQKGLGGL